MATKTIYCPKTDSVGVNCYLVNYQYFGGFALSQKRKCIDSLHQSALEQYGLKNILEISSKGTNPLGNSLSAFNLPLTFKGVTNTVEVFFQSAKKFELGGPYLDILNGDSRSAKTDERLRNSGKLLEFSLLGKYSFPIEPKTFFYDYLYINAISQVPNIAQEIVKYDGFSDIVFNEKKSINCQAYSAALFTSMLLNHVDFSKLINKKYFLSVTKAEYANRQFNFSYLIEKLHKISFSDTETLYPELVGFTYISDNVIQTAQDVLKSHKMDCYDAVNYQYWKNGHKGKCYWMWFNFEGGRTHAIYVLDGYVQEITPQSETIPFSKTVLIPFNGIEDYIHNICSHYKAMMKQNIKFIEDEPWYAWTEYIPENKRESFNDFIDKRCKEASL